MLNSIHYFVIADGLTLTTASATAGFKCAGRSGFFKDVADCRAYYICSGANPVVHMYCPSGRWFNAAIVACDFPSNVHTCGTTPASPTTRRYPVTTTRRTIPTIRATLPTRPTIRYYNCFINSSFSFNQLNLGFYFTLFFTCKLQFEKHF